MLCSVCAAAAVARLDLFVPVGYCCWLESRDTLLMPDSFRLNSVVAMGVRLRGELRTERGGGQGRTAGVSLASVRSFLALPVREWREGGCKHCIWRVLRLAGIYTVGVC